MLVADQRGGDISAIADGGDCGDIDGGIISQSISEASSDDEVGIYGGDCGWTDVINFEAAGCGDDLSLGAGDFIDVDAEWIAEAVFDFAFIDGVFGCANFDLFRAQAVSVQANFGIY